MNSKFTQIIRILLGLILLFSGLNKIFEFIPVPAGNLIKSFGQADYIFPLVYTLEILIAAMLLANKYVAFALILLVPLTLNILLVHLYFNFQGIIPALIVAILNGVLLYKHRRQYVPLFN